MFIQPFQLIVCALASWVNREQAKIIEYLCEENRILRERYHGKRLRFTDAERRRLAVRAKALGRRKLQELGTVVTPDTPLRWHRNLVAPRVRRES